MAKSEENSIWYHGSQQELTSLRPGSSITQNEAIARAFSHRPKLVSVSEQGQIKHDGTIAGHLYRVAETVEPEDIYPHPHPVNASRWEWLIKRELSVELVEATTVRPEEQLTAEEIEQLWQKQKEYGAQSFLDSD